MGKIVAIHQPNYIPWIGYFHKMLGSDIFVFLDDSQYSKNQPINRNTIKTAQGEMYLTVPVLIKGEFGQTTSEVKINNHINWRKKHWKSILLNYKKAKYFELYSHFFEELYQNEWDKLSELNEFVIRNIADFLKIEIDFIKSSELEIKGESTERLLNIVKSVEGDTYLSGIGAKDYLDEDMFTESEISLTYQDFHHPVYNQLYGEFKPKMSIIDLLFNEGPRSLEIIKGA
jgi:hypothetical protein